jgi:hypothetical protein
LSKPMAIFFCFSLVIRGVVILNSLIPEIFDLSYSVNFGQQKVQFPIVTTFTNATKIKFSLFVIDIFRLS